MITTEEKEEMLGLREEGWGTPALGIRYGLDHSTVCYHCKRPGILVQPRRSKSGVDKTHRIPDKDFIPDYILKNKTKPGIQIEFIAKPKVETKPITKVILKKKNKISRGPESEKQGKSYEERLRESENREVIRDSVGNVIKVKNRSPWLSKLAS